MVERRLPGAVLLVLSAAVLASFGSMPALLKAFLEQVLRPGFAFGAAERRGMPKKLLAGKSARIVVTMGMPAFFYRLYYRAHSLKSLERNILGFVGIKPVRVTLLGNVGFDPVYGARPLKRAIQQQLENPLASKILAGEFTSGDTVQVDAEGGQLAFRKG